MLPKKHRLHHASDIQCLLRHGRRIKVGDFFLFLKTNDSNAEIRCTVIVGKKFSARAAARNAQKRILREVLRDVINLYLDGSPFDAMIMCTKKGKVLSYKDAKSSFLPVFKSNIKG